jgi:hypothetical protein
MTKTGHPEPPGRSRAGQMPQDQAQVVPSNVDQVALVDVFPTTQPNPAQAAAIEKQREPAFNQFGAKFERLSGNRQSFVSSFQYVFRASPQLQSSASSNARGSFSVPLVLVTGPLTLYGLIAAANVRYVNNVPLSILYSLPVVALSLIMSRAFSGGFFMGGAVKG